MNGTAHRIGRRGATAVTTLAATVAIAAVTIPADAATQNWDTDPNTNGSQPGDGDWWDGVVPEPANHLNWSGGVNPPANDWEQGNIASFGVPNAITTITVYGDIVASGIRSSGASTGTIINASGGGGTLTLGGDGINMSANQGLVFNVPITLSADQVWGGTGEVHVNGIVSGGFGITKTSTNHNYTFTGLNTFSGPVDIQAGAITLSGQGSFQNVSTVTVAAGAGFTVNYSGNAGINRLNDTGALILADDFTIIGDATTMVNEAVGSITVDAGGTVLTLDSTGQAVNLLADSVTRSGNGTLSVRGDGLGATTTVMLTNPPAFTGSTDPTGSATRVLSWATGSDSAGGSATGFLTYDAANGLRLLQAGEYSTTITAGDNVVLEADAVVNASTSINSLVLTNDGDDLSGTGTLTVASGGVLTAGTSNISIAGLDFGTAEGVFHIAGNTTISSAITGSGGLTMAGGNTTLTLTAANSYTGQTTVNSGTLRVGNGNTTGDLGGSADVVLNGGHIIFDRSDDITISQNITGTVGNVTLEGDSVKTLAGTNDFRGNLNLNQGHLVVTGSTKAAGSTDLNGGSTIRVGDGASFTLISMDVGDGAGGGAFYQTGGDVLTENGDPSLRIGVNGYGYYELSGGTLTADKEFGVGAGRVRMADGSTGVAVFYQTGGHFDTDNMEIARGGNAHGVWYMTGGTYDGGGIFELGDAAGAKAQFTIASGAVVTEELTIGTATDSTGILNLNAGGTLQSSGLNLITTSNNAPGNGVRHVNFDGGTLRLAGDNSADMIVASPNYQVHIFDGGAIFDVVHASRIGDIEQALIAPAGDGLVSTTYAVANGGSGYLGAPVVNITGVTGATAVANMVDDESGNGTYKVASITITSPGINATAPTIELGSVPGAIAADVSGLSLATTENVSGGITKVGLGTLELKAVNTYTGETRIEAGTLRLGSGGSVAASSAINVLAGAVFDVDAITAPTVRGLKGNGNVTVDDAINVTELLAPGASVGTLTIDGGDLNVGVNAQYDFEIDGDTLSPTSDLIVLTDANGTVNFAGGWTLNLFNLGTVDPTGKTFVLFQLAGALQSDLGVVNIDHGSTGWTGGLVSLDSENNQIVLSNLELIPEPASLMLLGAGFGLLLRRRTA